MIVIADDDSASRTLCRLWLQDAGHQVVETASGEDAIWLIQRGGVQVLILHLGLADASAFNCLRALQRLEGAPRIIMVTERLSETLSASALALGAWKVILRPDHPQRFLELVLEAGAAPRMTAAAAAGATGGGW